jgi:tRNA-(ms[2]io[6]A)-hydroxylase
MIVSPSSRAWVEAACADLDTLLVDHAHCERKAAATALRLLSKLPRQSTALSRLAREELVHFERVVGELGARGRAFAPLPSAGYARALFAAARPGSLVDELLVCALIEARSHERFVHLGDAVGAPRLVALYRELGDAEARHGALYVELADEAARGEDVGARLAALAAREAEIVARPGQPLRMHAGG